VTVLGIDAAGVLRLDARGTELTLALRRLSLCERRTLAASVAPPALRVGETLRLTLRLEGASNLADFDTPAPGGLDGFEVVALNVTKLRSDNVDPREYLGRLEQWRARVEAGGGSWRVINDLDRLEKLLEG